jgi:hypothetical protein
MDIGRHTAFVGTPPGAGSLPQGIPNRIQSNADPVKEDKNNENIIHRFARGFIASSNITSLR